MDFERYNHEMGTWSGGSMMLGSEIRYTGDWYQSTEEEIVELIEKYADENPTTSYVGRQRDPSLRTVEMPDFIRRAREWRTPTKPEQIVPMKAEDSD